MRTYCQYVGLSECYSLTFIINNQLMATKADGERLLSSIPLNLMPLRIKMNESMHCTMCKCAHTHTHTPSWQPQPCYIEKEIVSKNIFGLREWTKMTTTKHDERRNNKNNIKQKKDRKRDEKKNAQTQKYYCPAETCSLKKIPASSNSDALFLSPSLYRWKLQRIFCILLWLGICCNTLNGLMVGSFVHTVVHSHVKRKQIRAKLALKYI